MTRTITLEDFLAETRAARSSLLFGPEQTLLARVIDNNDARLVLERIFASGEVLALGVELDQGELDVLREVTK